MAKIGLFYGSSTCYTEMAGEKIREQLGKDLVELHNINSGCLHLANQYDHLILGIPTWDYGELQEDWENVWDELDEINFKGKTVALYGLGDQIGYPDWFLDALGYLHAKVILLGASVVGYWPNEGYDFNESQALTEDGRHFVGLALDDEQQFELTDERIQIWCDMIRPYFS